MFQEKQLHEDVETLRHIFAGLDGLESSLDAARPSIQARQRGYFMPNEDDCVRQFLLAYRNYRLALYEIIDRYFEYEQRGTLPEQLRGFMVAYAAALMLYARSLKIVKTWAHEPLVRRKLNEPDVKFGIEPNFFEGILAAFTSLHNYRLLGDAAVFWKKHRRTARELERAGDPDCEWLCEVIRAQRPVVRRRFLQTLRARLRFDGRFLARSVHAPVRKARYSAQSIFLAFLADLRTTAHHRPSIGPTTVRALRCDIKPGDVLLMREERKLSTSLLPGFWSHAAIFVGDCSELEKLGVAQHPHVRKHWERVKETEAACGYVLEAKPPKVVFNSLEDCLHADHVLALRPNVSAAERTTAIEAAFGHVDKPYDFEFNFNVTSRIVCTELVYRSFHLRGAIQFPLIKRLGRYTLTADDIIDQFLASLVDAQRPKPFEIVALYLAGKDKECQMVAPGKFIETLRAIQQGFRPNSALSHEPDD